MAKAMRGYQSVPQYDSIEITAPENGPFIDDLLYDHLPNLKMMDVPWLR